MSESNSDDRRKELRREQDKELYTLLECRPAYFISAEKLGMVEQSIARMASTPVKRKRQIEFNLICQVIKALKITPQECEITGISFGCLKSGEAGMFITTASATKILGQIPEVLK